MWLYELAKGVYAIYCKWEGNTYLLGCGTLEEVSATWMGSDRKEAV